VVKPGVRTIMFKTRLILDFRTIPQHVVLVLYVYVDHKSVNEDRVIQKDSGW